MQIFFWLVILLLQIYQFLLIGYAIVNVVRMVRPDWRPQGFLLLAIDIVYRLVEPLLFQIRRVVPSLNLGAIQLDLAWIVAMFGSSIIINLVGFLSRGL